LNADAPDPRTLMALVYRILRPLLFQLDAERAHQVTLGMWDTINATPGLGLLARALLKTPALPVRVMGLTLPNPVGLAAGLDKDGRHVKSLSGLGFGWLELGTVTPRPQPGNPRPRLFRLITEQALVNRMGFNNGGVAALACRIARLHNRPLLGINIGKNRDTPLEQADEDYVQALRAVAAYADYVAVNVSSPNTPGLRGLQEEQRLTQLLRSLKAEQRQIQERSGRYVPLAVKLGPDLADQDVDALADLLLFASLDGVIATNTTVTRPGSTALQGHEGGLSGHPLKARATEVIVRLRRKLMGAIPIIAAGGIMNGQDAWDRLVAGADAVQVYTGLIYSGPALPSMIVNELQQRSLALGTSDLTQAVRTARSSH